MRLNTQAGSKQQEKILLPIQTFVLPPQKGFMPVINLCSTHFMILLIFFLSHWFLSLFFQTFFQHRYASHRMFTTSKTWERIFYLMAYLFEGTSF